MGIRRWFTLVGLLPANWCAPVLLPLEHWCAPVSRLPSVSLPADLVVMPSTSPAARVSEKVTKPPDFSLNKPAEIDWS